MGEGWRRVRDGVYVVDGPGGLWFAARTLGGRWDGLMPDYTICVRDALSLQACQTAVEASIELARTFPK